MSEPNTAPILDVFGHTIFCDDIRIEIEGKVTYVGSYVGSMLVKVPFPFTLPKFCFGVIFHQRREIYDPKLSLRIHLPGDAEDKPSVEADVQPPQDLGKDLGGEFYVIGTNMTFAPLVINSPGSIRVRMLRDGILHRIGSLNVTPASDYAIPSTVS